MRCCRGRTRQAPPSPSRRAPELSGCEWSGGNASGCDDPRCVKKTFVEQVPTLVAVRGSITRRAVEWALGQLRREHATIAGIARQLGTSSETVWRAIEPELVRLAADESRFDDVTTLGVDVHVSHNVHPRRRDPKDLTGPDPR